ncbi:MAG: hypothetical protein ABIY47_02770 [Opitutaceae bacterium]
METVKNEPRWERTNVTNLLRNRQSGTYYARVKVNGKQKWRGLKTAVFSVAKLRLAYAEKTVRSQALLASGKAWPVPPRPPWLRFNASYRAGLSNNSKRAASTEPRADDSVGTVIKKLGRNCRRSDVRRLTASQAGRYSPVQRDDESRSSRKVFMPRKKHSLGRQ